MSDFEPKWVVISDYRTKQLKGVRTWGETSDGIDKTRVDITLRSGDEWVISPVVGDTYWRGMSTLDLWVAMQIALRWIREMKEHGLDCNGLAPQLRPLNTPDYIPENPYPCDEY